MIFGVELHWLSVRAPKVGVVTSNPVPCTIEMLSAKKATGKHLKDIHFQQRRLEALCLVNASIEIK